MADLFSNLVVIIISVITVAVVGLVGGSAILSCSLRESSKQSL